MQRKHMIKYHRRLIAHGNAALKVLTKSVLSIRFHYLLSFKLFNLKTFGTLKFITGLSNIKY